MPIPQSAPQSTPQPLPLPVTAAQLDQLSINTIRTLSMDAVQQAKSGHPGTPMALAPLVYTIWNRVMRFDPADPIWPNRDRFVLSNGHASMLLWSVLHLTKTQAVNSDYERLGQPSVTLDDIRRFRQLDCKAPGHPEYRWVSGVETTTGPLGQGVATSVGMAIAGNCCSSVKTIRGRRVSSRSNPRSTAPTTTGTCSSRACAWDNSTRIACGGPSIPRMASASIRPRCCSIRTGRAVAVPGGYSRDAARRNGDTAETADSRIEPSTLAFHEPITSSTTNSTAVIGVLNAAAIPAAAPTGAISLR